MPSRKSSKRARFEAASSVQAEQQSDVRRFEASGLPGFSNVEEIEGFSDAAEILTDKLNQFLIANGDYDIFTVDHVKAILENRIHPQQLMNHVDSDFGQGLLIGHILTEEERDFLENMEDEGEDIA